MNANDFKTLTCPYLYVMVGLSGSGKTTLANKISQHNVLDFEIISSDDIREEICGDMSDQSRNSEVFEIFHKRIKENLLLKRNVIADATNLTKWSRSNILKLVKDIPCFVACIIVQKDVENCIKDNNKREKPVPEEVIRNQYKKFETPLYEEGFDYIVYLKQDSTQDNIMKEVIPCEIFGRKYN